MTSRELNKMLLSSIPEIKKKFEDETNWQEGLDTGSFIIFEDVFIPFLESKVELNDKILIEKIYSFIENLCDIDDEYVRNVLYVAILENISDFENPEPYVKYLKPKSLKIYNDNYKNKNVC